MGPYAFGNTKAIWIISLQGKFIKRNTLKPWLKIQRHNRIQLTLKYLKISNNLQMLIFQIHCPYIILIPHLHLSTCELTQICQLVDIINLISLNKRDRILNRLNLLCQRLKIFLKFWWILVTNWTNFKAFNFRINLVRMRFLPIHHLLMNIVFVLYCG